MAFCGNCGSNISDDKRYCPNCGAPVGAPRAQSQSDFTAKVKDLNNTADYTSSFTADDIAQNKAMAVLAYLGPLVLIPIFAAPNSRFARYHANQGLILLIADVAYAIVNALLLRILYAISGILGLVMSTVLSLVWIVFLVLVIIGIVNVCNGRAKELPIIGKFRILK